MIRTSKGQEEELEQEKKDRRRIWSRRRRRSTKRRRIRLGKGLIILFPLHIVFFLAGDSRKESNTKYCYNNLRRQES